jgi:hypothetical protein
MFSLVVHHSVEHICFAFQENKSSEQESFNKSMLMINIYSCLLFFFELKAICLNPNNAHYIRPIYNKHILVLNTENNL